MKSYIIFDKHVKVLSRKLLKSSFFIIKCLKDIAVNHLKIQVSKKNPDLV